MVILFKMVPYGTYILTAGYIGYEKLYTDTFDIDSAHDAFSLNLNHREKKINVFGNYNFSDYKSETNLNLLRDNSPSNEITYFDQDGRSLGRYSNQNFKAGVDYFINANNTIGFVGSKEIKGPSNKKKGSSDEEKKVKSN